MKLMAGPQEAGFTLDGFPLDGKDWPSKSGPQRSSRYVIFYREEHLLPMTVGTFEWDAWEV